MGIWKTCTCSICGLAFCAHVAHENHHNADYISRPLAVKPSLDTIVYVRLAHGEEPEAPSGPLQSPQATAAVSSSASASVRLTGISASAMAGNIVISPSSGSTS
jgi:hypothetical protein